jgi:hypothetical protein
MNLARKIWEPIDATYSSSGDTMIASTTSTGS